MQIDLEQRLHEDRKRRLRDKIAIALTGLGAAVVMYVGLNLVPREDKSEAAEQTSKKRTFVERCIYHGRKNYDNAKDTAYDFLFGSEVKTAPSDKKDGYMTRE